MYRVIPTERFTADVKYYIKKKHYKHIGEDIKSITDQLQTGNLVGDEISGLRVESDGHTYKVRAANSDMKVGESNGYRIIYYEYTARKPHPTGIPIIEAGCVKKSL